MIRNLRRSRRLTPWLDTLESRTLLSLEVPSPPDFGLLRVSAGLYEPDRVLVRYRADALDVPAGDQPAPTLMPELRVVRLTAGTSVSQALADLRDDPRVLEASPDYVMSVDALPNDPRYGSLYGLSVIAAPAAWDVTTGSAGVSVAVIDTGIDITHPDLYLNIWLNQGEIPSNHGVVDTNGNGGVDFFDLNSRDASGQTVQDGSGLPINQSLTTDLNGNGYIDGGDLLADQRWSDGLDNDGNGYVDDLCGMRFLGDGSVRSNQVGDDHGHGTHVAGTVGAVGNNGVGVTGVNWSVSLMALKFLDSTGSGASSDAIRALDYAVAMGATVSNNSYGGGPFETIFAAAIDRARVANHVFVAAAGNSGSNLDAVASYPASYGQDNIVAVAATNSLDQLASFSNYGLTRVDLAAPGVSILSTIPNAAYGSMSGTSMAAPHVAGAVALLQGLHPTWSYRQVIAKLFATVDPISLPAGKSIATGGRLNLGRAVTSETTGPQILAMNLASAPQDTVGRIRLTFSEPVLPASLATPAIASVTGPSGPVAVRGVTVVAGTGNTVVEVSFDRVEAGAYTLVVRPEVQDAAGNFMDQDGDGQGGVDPDDRFTGTVEAILAQTLLIDDGRAGYAETGLWTDSTLGGYEGDSRFARPTDPPATATWTFPVIPGATYDVAVTWPAYPNRASNAPYTIRDGSQQVGFRAIDQRVSPDDFVADGRSWERLGVHTITGTTLTVELTNVGASGVLNADAVRIEEVAPITPTIIDDASAGYAETGVWSDSTLGGYAGDSRYARATDPPATATWTFQVTTGATYDVAVTWPSYPNRAFNAPYTVLDGTQELGSRAIDQRVSPDDFAVDGRNWERLGTYTISGSTLTVRLTNVGASGVVGADAVRIEQVNQQQAAVASKRPALPDEATAKPGLWSASATATVVRIPSAGSLALAGRWSRVRFVGVPVEGGVEGTHTRFVPRPSARRFASILHRLRMAHEG